jgi:hypothetical protein
MTACPDFMSSLGHLAGPTKCWERKVWPPTGQTSSKITHGERGEGVKSSAGAGGAVRGLRGV